MAKVKYPAPVRNWTCHPVGSQSLRLLTYPNCLLCILEDRCNAVLHILPYYNSILWEYHINLSTLMIFKSNTKCFVIHITNTSVTYWWHLFYGTLEALLHVLNNPIIIPNTGKYKIQVSITLLKMHFFTKMITVDTFASISIYWKN